MIFSKTRCSCWVGFILVSFELEVREDCERVLSKDGSFGKGEQDEQQSSLRVGEGSSKFGEALSQHGRRDQVQCG